MFYFEVVWHGGETQLQVGNNVNWITERAKYFEI